MTWWARGLVRGGMAVVSAVLLAVHLALLIPGFGLGLIFLIPWPFATMRPVTSWARRLAGGVPAPYQPKPPPPTPEPDGRFRQDNRLYKRAWWPRAAGYMNWVFGDASTWRDLGWMMANPVVGAVLGFGPLLLAVAGVVLAVARPGPLGWWWIPVGVVAFGLGAAVAPAAVRAHDAWTRRVLGPPPVREGAGAVKVWIFERSLALFRLLLLGVTSVAAALYGVVLVVLTALFAIGLVFFLPGAAENVRWLTNLRRRLAGEWSGVPVEVPYRVRPQLPPRRPDGMYEFDNHLYKTPQWTHYVQRLDWIWRDPATWRDLGWAVLDPIVGGALVLATVGALAVGFVEQVIPTVLQAAGAPDISPPLILAGRPWAAFALGVAMMVFGVVAAPAVLRRHGRWTAWLLAPTEKARLDLRVRQLTESRDDANEAQAAELRRIERDLHDGAQARLVAVGITLGLVDSLLDKDPAAARRLIAEARDTSAKALAELRDLVRGVHPPVLQERGLGDAVRALALDAAIPTTVEVDLAGRLPAPIEAAAYFAVGEAFANAAKHSGATRVEVRIEHDGRALYASVRDDGRGGADPAHGSGLRGLRHRLAAFDGTVRVSSPPGGPTVVTLEVPCASSSPRTSTS